MLLVAAIKDTSSLQHLVRAHVGRSLVRIPLTDGGKQVWTRYICVFVCICVCV